MVSGLYYARHSAGFGAAEKSNSDDHRIALQNLAPNSPDQKAIEYCAPKIIMSPV